MKKIRKGKILLLILLLILIIFELIAFQNSRAEKVISISATFSDSKNIVNEITETIEATDEDESGYSIVLPDVAANKKISKYYITSKLINESNELEEENVIEKIPGDIIYLTDQELGEKQINFEIEYDIKDDLYNQKLKLDTEEFSITVEGYLPLNAELKATPREAEEISKENEDIDKFINAAVKWKGAYELEIISEEKEFNPEEKLKITFESTEDITEPNKYKVINITNKLNEIEDFSVEGNTIFFESENLGTYIIMQEVDPQINTLALTRAITEDGTYENVWDGTSATELEYGSGTEQEPYLITRASELKYIADQVNSGTTYENTYFQLASNINLNGNAWTPIGNTNNSFNDLSFNLTHKLTTSNNAIISSIYVSPVLLLMKSYKITPKTRQKRIIR